MSKRSSCPKGHVVIAALIVSLASACANGTRSAVDDAPVVANASVMWEDGLKAADTGEAMLTRGEKRLVLGRQQVREGEERIRAASERVAQAKLEYEQLVADGSTATDNKAQAEALRAIGIRWEAAIKEIREGNKLVAKGNANIDRGESEIRDGRLLMEKGSIMMRNAHRSRLGKKLLTLPAG